MGYRFFSFLPEEAKLTLKNTTYSKVRCILEDRMFHILENCNRKKIEKLEGRSTLNLWSCQQASCSIHSLFLTRSFE